MRRHTTTTCPGVYTMVSRARAKSLYDSPGEDSVERYKVLALHPSNSADFHLPSCPGLRLSRLNRSQADAGSLRHVLRPRGLDGEAYIEKANESAVEKSLGRILGRLRPRSLMPRWKDSIDSIPFSSILFVSFVLATCRRVCLLVSLSLRCYAKVGFKRVCPSRLMAASSNRYL
jgi:hypothetical protein